MYFKVTVPNTVDAMGVPNEIGMFPSAVSIEDVHIEPREKEIKVTYAQANLGEYELPAKAAENLMKAWPDQVDAIMRDIRPCGGYYGFHRWGMFVGVETDGYIHT